MSPITTNENLPLAAKQCIWCCKQPPHATFLRAAHTFPRSLGGKTICSNVCDSCNTYFGSPTKEPAIEVVLKEILNISRFFLLSQTHSLKESGRFKSVFFNYNLSTQTIRIKPKYSLKQGYQEKLGRLFTRGIYKVFLEEREVQRGDALDERFDFIRKFSRYNLNDSKIYILKPKFGAVFFSTTDVLNPELRFTEASNELDDNFRAFEYTIMGHHFCIPTSMLFDHTCLLRYKKYLRQQDHPFGVEIYPINKATDIDITFSHMDRS